MQKLYKKNKNIIFWTIFALVLLAQIFLQYYGLFKYHYPVPPGDDCVNHFILANKFFNGQSLVQTIISTSYPPFFHWLTAELAKLFHLDTIKILLYLTPALPVGASVSIYLLTKVIYNRRAALLTMIAYSFLAISPYQLLSDGGYPNLLASGIYIPLIIIFVSQTIESKQKIWNSIGAVFMFILVLLTHHLSSIYLILILFLSLPFLIYFNTKSKPKLQIALYFLIASALIVMFLYFLFKTPLLNPIRQMILNVVMFSSKYPFISFPQNPESNTVLNFKATALLIGLPISLFGFTGLLYFTFNRKWRFRNSGIIMIIIWATLLLLGSRLSFLSNPDRLVRDAVIPLAILAGGVLDIGLFQNKSFNWKLIVLVILILSSIQPFSVRIKNSIIFNNMVRYTNEDKDAISRITKNDPDPIILSLSCDDWLNYLVPGNKSLVENKGDNPIDYRLSHFDYIYAEVNNTSWTPTRCKEPNLNQLKTNPKLIIEDNYQKNYSSVYIFKIRQ